MTRAREAEQMGLRPHWKIRVVIRGGAMLHLATEREPGAWHPFKSLDEVLRAAGLIEDYRYGDTPGYIDEGAVAALTWRYVPASPQDGDTP